MKRARILVVDDKESYLALFRRILPDDLDICCASDGARAHEMIRQARFDVVITDVRMPGVDGVSLLRAIRDDGHDAEVILMTAYGSIGEAVRAMKLGAADFLTKPFEPAEAVAAIEQALARRARVPASAPVAPRLVGASAAMKPVLDLVARAGQSEATVLVTGESGTGKELVAAAIHARSARAKRRFVAVNCGALPEALVESELFGYVKGAFTGAVTNRRGLFEESAGGTLFLDEVGELPLAAQVKLTRVLQERSVRPVGGTAELPVNTRVVAATNVDLSRAVAAGSFREDLYYRLNVLSIPLPPLRARRDDIPLLARALLERMATPGRHRTLGADAAQALAAYHWPGNVRQLENALARALAVGTGDEIALEDLPAEIRETEPHDAVSEGPSSSLPYREALALERDRSTRVYLVALLRDVRGSVTQAAERAGIERESFHRLMKKHGVRAEDYRAK